MGEILIEQRTVTFMGMSLVVPLNTSYMAMDCDGVISAFSDKPWLETGFYEGNELGEIIRIEPPVDIRWSETLRKYEPIKTD